MLGNGSAARNDKRCSSCMAGLCGMHAWRRNFLNSYDTVMLDELVGWLAD